MSKTNLKMNPATAILDLDDAEKRICKVHSLDFGVDAPYGDVDGFVPQTSWNMTFWGHHVRATAHALPSGRMSVYAAVTASDGSMGCIGEKDVLLEYVANGKDLHEIAQEAARDAWDDAMRFLKNEAEAEAEAEAERVCDITPDGHDLVEVVGLVLELRDMVSKMGLALARYDSRFGADRDFWDTVSTTIPSRCKTILARHELPIDKRLEYVK